MFTILLTIPAALLTGAWMYKIRPGKVGEASVLGVAIVLAGVILGRPFPDSWMGPYLIFSKPTLSIMLPIYAAIASILPVWVLMCPRDYLSSYMKVGVIVVLAVGHFPGAARLENARHDALPGRRRAGRERLGLAVRLHRHHVRGAVGLPCPDRVGHHAEDDQQGVRHPADRLRGDDPRRLRGADGADRGLRVGAGRLLQNQHRPGHPRGTGGVSRRDRRGRRPITGTSKPRSSTLCKRGRARRSWPGASGAR